MKDSPLKSRDLSPHTEPLVSFKIGPNVENRFEPKDIRTPERLADVDNDAQVEFVLGKSVKVEGYGVQVSARLAPISGSIHGTDVPIPSIHYMSRGEFARLASECDENLGLLAKLGEVGGWYVPGMGSVEMPIHAEREGEIPKLILMRAFELKTNLAQLEHELQHAAGYEEFLAYRRQHDFELAVGLRDETVSNLEIMKFITKEYDESLTTRALKEFETFCDQNGFGEEVVQYYEWIAEQNETFDEFGDGFAYSVSLTKFRDNVRGIQSQKEKAA